ncbi:MAG TPA: NYN domain-containing protein [Ktedonobacterales bacterium]
MSQATSDHAAHSGSPDDSGETRSAAKTRRRPTHRGRGATKSAETAAPAAIEAPSVSETPVVIEAPAAIETPTTTSATPSATEEQPARGEAHETRRSRGGAKRPAARSKTGAQLIINKPAETTEAASPTAPAADVTPEVGVVTADAAPLVVPVVAPEAEATPAPAPLKTRFGQPRRLRQTPAAVSVAPAEPAPIAEPAPAAETEAAAPAAETAPTPRYRFDRARSASRASAVVRPERLSVPHGGLYTSDQADETPPVPAEAPTEEPGEPLFALPSLEALTSASDELPALAFGEPVAAESDQTEEPGEPLEDVESGDAASAASRRRRRRRRSGHNGAHGVELEEAAEEDEEQAGAAAEALETPPFVAEPEEYPQPAAPRETRPVHGERPRAGRFGLPSRVTRRAPAEPIWEAPPPAATETSPYGSPEPASARGFGPTPAGVATPAREVYPRPGRIERGDSAAASTAQLGAVIREAISTQTDRLLSELRRQQPPAVTLALPNTQTAERVGVFVDVANVIYSARNLRTSVDFGHLLDFLRANRRLTRAQAYAPTDPLPGAEQAFLSAVKGLGYRITTKNYKTFSNGAKKADLDLDLCMDIVRMVDSKAVDTIVLVSGDSDFLPLLDYCSDHGVRVEVAAFDDAASMILRQSCDLFINLSLVEGIRG